MFAWAKARVPLTLPDNLSPASLPNLGAHISDVYRLHFKHEVAAGAVKPLILPYAIIATFVLPVVYFSIPHVQRPWLYRARWLLMAFIVAFNLYETWTSSSGNIVMGYVVGLMQSWGILWSATLLVWMRPQFEAERVEKRRRRRRGESTGHDEGENGHGHAVGNGHVVRQSGYEAQQKQNGHAVQVNGHHQASPPAKEQQSVSGVVDPVDAPDEDVARSLRQGYEYYWQAYPADAPLATRLGWSIDLVLSFRGTGKTDYTAAYRMHLK